MPTPRPTLFVSVDPDRDYLVAHEFGRVSDATPQGLWEGVTEDVGLLHDGPGGPVVGLGVHNLSEYDPDADETACLWQGPRFDAPMLGLTDVPAGAVIIAARQQFLKAGTFNRFLFSQASEEEDPTAAERAWRSCLGTGDMMAHYGLGYTLLELRRFDEAYHHLRYYTELAPNQPWAWRYRGVAAEAIDDPGDARRCYRRAIKLTADGGEDTDADELLEALNSQPGARRRKPHGHHVELWGEDLTRPGMRRTEAISDELAIGVARSADPLEDSADAVAAIQFDGCDVLVCAKGHDGPAAGHALLRALLDELRDTKNPVELAEDGFSELWAQVLAKLPDPQLLGDDTAAGASATIAILCCDADLWSAVGDAQLAFIGESGSVTLPDPGGSGPLTWGEGAGDLDGRVRHGSYRKSEPGRMLLHTRLPEVLSSLPPFADEKIPADVALRFVLDNDETAAGVLGRA